MLFFGHIGCSVLVSEFIHKKLNKPKVKHHLWLVAFLAVLLDIIDKPLALYGFPHYHNGRIFFHTVIVNVIMFLVLRKIFPKYQHYLIIIPLHLLFDFVYEFSFLVTLSYPFMGLFPATSIVEYSGPLVYVFRVAMQISPIGIFFEIVGFATLATMLWRRYILHNYVKRPVT
ncbi:MAG: hypothetical protein HQK53_01830 [Oligoflexia bacterium]|nr:hypothetical protein [Oligoflexia bacterium]